MSDPLLRNEAIYRAGWLLNFSNVFMTFAWYAQPLRWDYLWAGLCLLGAVYFIFRAPAQ